MPNQATPDNTTTMRLFLSAGLSTDVLIHLQMKLERPTGFWKGNSRTVQLGRADRAVAWDGGEPTSHASALGHTCQLVFQGLDLPARLEDPRGNLLDRVADQRSVMAEDGESLPSLDCSSDGGRGKALAMIGCRLNAH